MIYSKITGTGSYLPEQVLTNSELEKIVDTTDEWIRSRTGIEKRHVARDDETTCDLAEKASRAAIKMAGKKENDIDLIIIFDSKNSNISFNDIEWGKGFGVTISSPFGPIRLDYSNPLNNKNLPQNSL